MPTSMKTPSKLHPLHTPEMLIEWIANTGNYPKQNRRTGRTTAIALETIAIAITRPRLITQGRDHGGGSGEALKLAIEQIINRLGLRHLTVSLGNDDTVLVGFGEQP